MWHCWTIHLSLCSSVLGNKEGSLWTAAKTFIHTQWLLLAVSTSSPGVSHTNSLPVSTRTLSSCFLPYMATELLWWRCVCVCVDSNHDLILLILFDTLSAQNDTKTRQKSSLSAFSPGLISDNGFIVAAVHVCTVNAGLNKSKVYHKNNCWPLYDLFIFT